MDVRQALARNVRSLRQGRGWSQEEAAAAARMPPPYLSEIETAKRNPTILVVEKLAQAFGVSVGRLFDERA